ncbi:MAG: T9SS type A sorting domain-containing protein [Bacteroidota bacterium]
MKKFLFIISVFLVFAGTLIPSNAQQQKQNNNLTINDFKEKTPELLSTSNAGNEFWLTFLPCYEQSGASGVSLKIYVSSAVQTYVTMEIPGKGVTQQKNVLPNEITEFTINPTFGQVYRKLNTEAPAADNISVYAGVHVFSNDPIIVYAVTRFPSISESYLAIPVSSLGKEYIVSSWADIGDNGASQGQYFPSYTACVAAYDQTIVRFTLGGTATTRTAGGMKPGETQSISMNKGDVYLRASSGSLSDLSGSKWRSSKPISVISGSYGSYVPESACCLNFMTEMEIPTHLWGKEYHCTPIAGRLKNSFVKIFAKDANTKVYRNGILVATLESTRGLEAESWLRMRADAGTGKPVVFSADKPISVTQYNTGQDDDGIDSKPFQINLTPIEEYLNEITFNTPGTTGSMDFTNNWINIIYQVKDDGLIPDDLEFAQVENGNFVWQKLSAISSAPGMQFTSTLNGKKYASKQLKLPADGVYKMKADSSFGVYAYGFNNFESYGHPAGVGLKLLSIPDTLPPDPQWSVSCDGSVRGKNGEAEATVEDMPRNDTRSNMASIYFDSGLSYNYRFTYKSFIPGEDSIITWRAWVNDIKKDAKIVLTFTDRAGNDTTITIEYFARNFDIKPDIDFGQIENGDSVTKEIWIYNRSTSSSFSISGFIFKYKSANFQILDLTLPFIIQKEDSIKCRIQFKATTFGDMIDSIGVLDSCDVTYNAELKAKVIENVIGVDDTNPNMKQEKIRNFRVYPNPFESGTTFSFDSDLSGNSIDIEIFDILGSKITTINNIISEGENRINWNGRDRSGSKLKSGVYFARLKNETVYSQLSLMIFIQ